MLVLRCHAGWLLQCERACLALTLNNCTHCSVYLAKWREIDVACKLLLGAAADLNNEAAAAASLSLSNPVLRNLKEAGGGALGWGGWSLFGACLCQHIYAHLLH